MVKVKTNVTNFLPNTHEVIFCVVIFVLWICYVLVTQTATMDPYMIYGLCSCSQMHK